MTGKNHHAIRRAVTSLVEQLEQRRMLSSSVTSTLKPDTDPDFNILVVTGTKNKDYITVFDDPEDNSVIVFNDKNHNGVENSGEDTEYDDADLDAVFIDAQQGDDTVKYELVSSYDGSQRSIEVDLSDGNDKFTFESLEQSEGVSADSLGGDTDILDHSNINIEVDGQEKNDTIDIDFADINIDESSVLVNVDAGAGNDKVSFESSEDTGDVPGISVDQVAGPTSEFTQVQVQIDLGSGNNLYEQTISGDYDLAQMTINVNGGSGKDTIQDNEEYFIDEDSELSFTANLEGGDDYYNGEFGFNYVENDSEVTYNLQGGDGNDRMTFEADQQPFSPNTVVPNIIPTEFGIDGIFQVNMYGGTGNDTMDMWDDQSTANNSNAKPNSASSNDEMAPMFFGTSEEGSVRVVMSGDAGNDKVLMNLGITEGSTGDYDLSVLGAAGKDTVAAGFEDDTLLASSDSPPTSTITFGPSGAILLDGGRDTDKYQVVSFEDDSTFPATLFTPFSIRSCETASNSLLPGIFI